MGLEMSEQLEIAAKKQVVCHFCDRARFYILQLETSRFVRLCWYCLNYLRVAVYMEENVPRLQKVSEMLFPPEWLGLDELPPVPTIRCSMCEAWCSREQWVYEGRHINLCKVCTRKFWKEGRRV